jgi:hypothetical protein
MHDRRTIKAFDDPHAISMHIVACAAPAVAHKPPIFPMRPHWRGLACFIVLASTQFCLAYPSYWIDHTQYAFPDAGPILSADPACSDHPAQSYALHQAPVLDACVLPVSVSLSSGFIYAVAVQGYPVCHHQ